MTELVVRASMGTASAWPHLAPAFNRLSGHTLKVTEEGSQSLAQPLAGNAPADLMVVYTDQMNELARRGPVFEGPSTVFARAAVGLSVRSGAVWPDVGTPEALKRTLLAARSLCFSLGGSGGVAVRALEKLGITEQMKPRIVRSVGGPAAGYVARGEAEMAIQQVNVSKPVAGTDYVGHLPDELHEYVVFVVAVMAGSRQAEAARALVRFLTSPQAGPLLREGMMEPASGGS